MTEIAYPHVWDARNICRYCRADARGGQDISAGQCSTRVDQVRASWAHTATHTAAEHVDGALRTIDALRVAK